MQIKIRSNTRFISFFRAICFVIADDYNTNCIYKYVHHDPYAMNRLHREKKNVLTMADLSVGFVWSRILI